MISWLLKLPPKPAAFSVLGKVDHRAVVLLGEGGKYFQGTVWKAATLRKVNKSGSDQ